MHALPTTRPPRPTPRVDGAAELAATLGLTAAPTLTPPPAVNVDPRPEIVPPGSSDRQTSAVAS